MGNLSVDDVREIADIVVKSIQTGQKHDPASTVSTWNPAHGPGGLFTGGVVRPGMYSAMPQPDNALLSALPLVASNKVNEIYEVLTGQTVTEGTRAADICSEGPVPGQLKVCRQVIPWGLGKLDTRVQRLNTFGRRTDYADLDRNFFNLQGLDSPYIPDVLRASPDNVNTNTGKMLYEAARAWMLSYERMDIQGVAGNTSNNADFNVWIDQYSGLDRWIRTGYVDSVTSVACPAVDSIIMTHNAPIGSAGTNGGTFIQNVVDAVYAVRERAATAGLGNVEIAIVVHPNFRRALYDTWACGYNTDRCVGAAASPTNQDALYITQVRDEMYRGQFLLVDGEAVPVLTSFGMQNDATANNTYNTDIFVIPLRAMGSALTYRQYFPLNNADIQAWLAAMPDSNSVRIINNGLYALGMRTTNGFCSKIEIMSQSRLIMDTPFLAARVNDVSYTYRAQTRDLFVGQSLYADGGQSGRP